MLFTELRSGSSMQELVLRIEPRIRSWVRDEVERAIQSIPRSSLDIEATQSRAFQLHFEGKTPSTIFTGSKIEPVDNRPITVVLRDASSKQIITSGPLSTIKVGVVVVDGDFNPNDREDWTEEEFSKKVVREREGKRPLLTGDSTIHLKNGVGYLADINFTDNSSWIRSGTFRLGLKALNCSGELRVREGVSKSFTVKDHRGESYRKHYPPSLDDEIWRLQKIAKDGPSHKRLSEKGIFSVKHFLRLFVMNPSLLRNMLACGMSNNTWEKIIQHARTCKLDDSEWYIYKAPESIVLVFNCIYELVGAILDGQNFQSLDKLDKFHTRIVDNFKHRAYKNYNEIVPLEDHSWIGQAAQVSNLQIGISNSPSSSQQNINIPFEQDQLELLSNSDHNTISPPLTYTFQQDDPTTVSEPEIQAFNSTLGSDFLISDPSCDLYAGQYDWSSSGSLESLALNDYTPPGNNYQFGTPEWQENGLLASSNIQPVFPNFGFHVTRHRKPKARWCKIRAVLKWKILVKKNVAARKWKGFYM